MYLGLGVEHSPERLDEAQPREVVAVGVDVGKDLPESASCPPSWASSVGAEGLEPPTSSL